MNIASSGQTIFLHHFVSWTDVGFSTGSAHWQRVRHGGGGASFFWRGRGKIVLHTLERDCWSEDDDVWECSNRTLIKSYGVNQFFACISGHPQKKTALTWDYLDLLFKQDSGYINQTKFIIRVGLAHCNNKPFSSNTSLACHNYCNHIFPEVQTLVNVCLRNPQLYD